MRRKPTLDRSHDGSFVQTADIRRIKSQATENPTSRLDTRSFFAPACALTSQANEPEQRERCTGTALGTEIVNSSIENPSRATEASPNRSPKHPTEAQLSRVLGDEGSFSGATLSVQIRRVLRCMTPPHEECQPSILTVVQTRHIVVVPEQHPIGTFMSYQRIQDVSDSEGPPKRKHAP